MGNNKSEGSYFFTWAVILGLSLGFIVWGLFNFYATNAKWPPPWRYGTIPDTPSISPYVTSSEHEFPGRVPHPIEGLGLIRRQHVMGRDIEGSPLPQEKNAP